MNALPPKVAPFAALLSGTRFARALESRAQVLIVEIGSGEARRLVYASPAARHMLGAQSLDLLDAIVLSGKGPGARRIRELSVILQPGAAPRLISKP